MIERRYPAYSLSVLPLSDIFNHVDVISATLQEAQIPNSVEHNDEPFDTNQQKLDHLLLSLPSASSRSDMISILRTRLLVEMAKANYCESILWGDSTTRLAEKTLAETAKGRGFSLPWQVTDGLSPFGVRFNYPLRDLLKKELITYATLISPPLTDLVIPQSPASPIVASSKSTTIDDLMTQYFESVEENYPSIVANVVRTSSKLRPHHVENDKCSVCDLPVQHNARGLFGWGGDQGDTTAEHKDSMCYGCARSTLGSLLELSR
jgi:cytoplasmic tRNA 2-thiolation protein 2